MTSPVQLLHTYSSETLFATPNFDEIRDGGVQDPDFGYFDGLDSTGDSYLLDGADYSQANWDFTSKDRPEPLVDPFLIAPPPTFGSAGLDLGASDLLSPPRELTPPPSAVDAKPQRVWPAGKAAIFPRAKPTQKLPAIDTQTDANQRFARHHGQITPPMSSKSPESESIADPTITTTTTLPTKRGRKPSAKAAAKKEVVTAPPAAPKPTPSKPSPRKARKTKVEAAAENEEESQSEESKAKRARFLERNRQAAFTCRQRKKQWAKDLEERHRNLERENQNLKLLLVGLREEHRYLRQEVISHTTCGCTGARDYIQQSSRVLASEAAAAAASRSGSSSSRASAGPSGVSSSTLSGASIEQALRASLAQFESDHPASGLKEAGSLDFVHEGPELDGMTL